VDGRLDDAAWAAARVERGFVQRNPREGEAPGAPSELRVLYDAGALYIGLRLLDPEPHRIRLGLGRRDAPPDSDRVRIYLDPVLSGDRGYWFQVNASGVLSDGVIYDENVVDSSWDGVWDARARVDEKGWTAEFRIPLSGIAYQDVDRQQWGMHVERYIQRTQEKNGWPAMPRTSVTFVSRFGRLTGLQGLKREASLRLLPYVAGELSLQQPAGSTRPDERFRPNAGLDLRYSFSGGSALSAAINPDFGQVEEDPAVVNLSPDETFFGEKRPFFLEGATLFRTPIRLLHTRRIGARPVAPDAAFGGEIEEVDPEARIIGAAKVIGHHGIVSYGVLDAVVLPSSAVERKPDGGKADRVAHRGGNHAAARVLLRPKRWASVGLLATGLTRFGSEEPGTDDTDAYSGGLDWDLRNDDGWRANGQLAVAGDEDGAGYALQLRAGLRGAPRWRYWLDVESFSPDFEINHLGFQWRTNMARFAASVQHRLPNPTGSLRELYVTLWGRYAFRHDAPKLSFDRRVEVNTWFMFNNLWELWCGGGHRFPVDDDRETRGGPAYPRPEETYVYLGGNTDSSKAVWLGGTSSFTMEGSSPYFRVDMTLTTALLDRLKLSLFVKYRRWWDRPRWVETADRQGRPGYLFGDLNRDAMEARLSGVLGVTRDLTVSLFGQLLYDVGRYSHYRELLPLDDGRVLLGQSASAPDADFSRLSMIINTVLRWDLSGGAAAYLVYKMSATLSRDGASAVSFDPGGDLEAMFDQDQSHLLLTKLSYGWDL